jgi:ankyrin repeat protein
MRRALLLLLWLGCQKGHLLGRDWPLARIAAQADIKELEKALPGRTASERVQALVVAAGAGRGDSVALLLKAGTNVNGRDQGGGITALIMACYSQIPAMVAQLLEAKADPNLVNDQREAPLYVSARGDSLEIVDRLLAAGARVDAREKGGRTALIGHAQEGHEAIVRRLLEKGANASVADDEGTTALIIAAANGHAAVVKLLLKSDPLQRNKKGASALGAAIAEGRREVVEVLLATRPDLDAPASSVGGTVETAAAFNRAELVPLLVKAGAHVDHLDKPEGLTALHLACFRGYLEVARALLAAGASLTKANETGLLPLHAAAFGGQLEVVKLLVQSGAKINQTNKLGSTPIRAAADGGKVEVVRWLLAQGADPRIPDIWGRFPVDYAREGGHDEVVKLLVSASGPGTREIHRLRDGAPRQ